MPMTNTNTLIRGFWDRMDEAVIRSGMTKKEITARMGVHRHFLNSDSRGINSGYLAKFCGVTGTSADWLLGLKGGA